MTSTVGNIRLISVDLDNTLLTDRGQLMLRSADALMRAAECGVQVVIATTRGFEFGRVASRLLGLRTPLITSNGAEIAATAHGPMWACHTIPAHIALEIATLADAHEWEFSIGGGTVTRYLAGPDQAAGMLTPSRTLVANSADAVTDQVSRMFTHDEAAANKLRPLCETRFAAHCRTETYYKVDGCFHSFGVFPKLADKGTALRLVLERLGISAENALAIGDNFNDVPMFKVAGTSVAMGNAVDAVKQQATHVAPPFSEDGVAWAVEHLVLGER
ncbi:MAG: HAD family hydrolase [Candidatus Promineifilaceae bacterium]